MKRTDCVEITFEEKPTKKDWDESHPEKIPDAEPSKDNPRNPKEDK